MTTGPAPLCVLCKHFLKGGPEREGQENGFFCRAFPAGIPDEIVFSDHDHRKPFEGDRGIRFELRAGEELPPHYDRVVFREDPP